MYKIMHKINSECSNILDLKDTVPSLLLVSHKRHYFCLDFSEVQRIMHHVINLGFKRYLWTRLDAYHSVSLLFDNMALG